MIKIVKTIIIFLAVFLSCGFVLAQENVEKIEMNFFFSPTCSHCQAEEAFIPSLQNKYPELEVKSFNVANENNIKILMQFYKDYGVLKEEQGSVPITFIGDKYFLGFNDEIGKNIDESIKNFIENGFKKPKPKPAKSSLNILAILSGALILILGFVVFNLIWTRRQRR